MNDDVIIEATITVVDRTLRREFCEDFYKRCAYAAMATCNLLADKGIQSEMLGGNFAAFVVSPDGRRAGMSGYGFSREQSAHFWVEAAGRYIDIGPHYLPLRPGQVSQAMPPAVWPVIQPLPRYLRYQVLERFLPDARFNPDPEIETRAATFLAKCRERQAKQFGNPKFPRWLLTGPQALLAAASKRDDWAMSAVRFEGGEGFTELPF